MIGRWSCAVALALCSLSCEGPTEQAAKETNEYTGPANRCRATSECGLGQVCHADLDLCVAAPPGRERQFFVTFSSALSRTLGLPPLVIEIAVDKNNQARVSGDDPMVSLVPVRVISRVRTEPNPALGLGERYVRAELSFVSMTERDAGLDLHPVPALSASQTGIFEVSLSPGHYSLEVRPLLEETARTPVAFFEDIEVDNAGLLYTAGRGEPLEDLLLPAASEPRVTGVVRRAGLPEGGLTVDALDPTTGRVISTTSTTTCGQDKQPVCGAFSIGLAPGVSSYDLRIRRPSDPAYPTLLVPGLTTMGPLPTATTSFSFLGQPVRLHLGFDAPAEIGGTAFAYDPVAGASVVFSGTTSDGGHVVLRAHTNESGFVETVSGRIGVFLYPGTYDAVVFPTRPLSDAQPAYCVQRVGPLALDGSATSYGPFVETLTHLRQLSGEVLAAGVAVPGARVTAQPTEPNPSAAGGAVTYTDEAGRFSMRLDPALYRLTVEPPVRTRFAWSTEALVDLSQGEVSPTINLSVPVVVFLPSELSAAVGLGSVEVSWYERRDDGPRLVYRRKASRPTELLGLLPP